MTSRREVRRGLIIAAAGTLAAVGIGAWSPAANADNVVLRMSTPATATDNRSLGLEQVFAPAIKSFATYEPHYGATLFKQGTELEAIARGERPREVVDGRAVAVRLGVAENEQGTRRHTSPSRYVEKNGDRFIFAN